MMPHETSGPAAYLAASQLLIDRCELLLAVWDGSDTGGTADAVAYARYCRRSIEVVWPEGTQRS